MFKRKRRQQSQRVSDTQLDCLISYMEDHNHFARGLIMKLGPSGHEKYNKMWLQLSVDLNALGKAQKNPKQWEQTWKSLRLRAKNRLADYRTQTKQTGFNNALPVSDNMDRISRLFGRYGTGMCVIQEIGVDNAVIDESDDDEDIKNMDLSNLDEIGTTKIDTKQLFQQIEQCQIVENCLKNDSSILQDADLLFQKHRRELGEVDKLLRLFQDVNYL